MTCPFNEVMLTKYRTSNICDLTTTQAAVLVTVTINYSL